VVSEWTFPNGGAQAFSTVYKRFERSYVAIRVEVAGVEAFLECLELFLSKVDGEPFKCLCPHMAPFLFVERG